MRDDPSRGVREPVVAVPDFLIVGAMRSGTTWLARLLGSHPDIYMAPGKELHFFDLNYARGLNWYTAQFAGARVDQITGEATPSYMYEAEAVDRMATALPSARILAILRDPVDRAYSHFWRRRAQGRENLSFSEALDKEAARLVSGDVIQRLRYSYFDRGRYLPQLVRLASRYPRRLIKVIVLEEAIRRPAETYSEVCGFLEVDDTARKDAFSVPTNQYRDVRWPWLARQASGAPRLLRKAIGKVNAGARSYPPLDAATRAGLARRYAGERAALERWLGKDLSVWSSPTAADESRDR